MLEPMTASPVTPMSAVPAAPDEGCAWARSVLMRHRVVHRLRRQRPARMARSARHLGGGSSDILLTGHQCTECTDWSEPAEILGCASGCVVTLIGGPDDRTAAEPGG